MPPFPDDPTMPDDSHPIELAMTLARARAWSVDRMDEDRVALMVEGQWRRYALTITWAENAEMVQFLCPFEMNPADERLPALYRLINDCNDRLPLGAFIWWHEQRLMVWRHALCLAGRQPASCEQIDTIITSAIRLAERFYPAFQLALWGEPQPTTALQVAIADTWGHA